MVQWVEVNWRFLQMIYCVPKPCKTLNVYEIEVTGLTTLIICNTGLDIHLFFLNSSYLLYIDFSWRLQQYTLCIPRFWFPLFVGWFRYLSIILVWLSKLVLNVCTLMHWWHGHDRPTTIRNQNISKHIRKSILRQFSFTWLYCIFYILTFTIFLNVVCQ